ncbi:MAG: hypothetical protein ACRYFZ_18480 [Janthinobacterium lividum]
MQGPFAINYGSPTLANYLFLGEVDDNVPYARIFAAGQGGAAAAIALAGVGIGNCLLYAIVYGVAGSKWVRTNTYASLGAYCMLLMCAGNVWSYVPIRALTTHADIALVAQGTSLAPLVLFALLLLPAGFVIYHFLAKACARTWPALVQHSGARLAFLAGLTGYWLFGLFGSVALSGSYGLVSQIGSIISVYLLFPLSLPLIWQRYSGLLAR